MGGDDVALMIQIVSEHLPGQLKSVLEPLNQALTFQIRQVAFRDRQRLGEP